MNFLQYQKEKRSLNEAVSLEQLPIQPGRKFATVFFGRFQPVTKAHTLIMLDMKSKYPSAEPFVYIIKGEKSSLDKERNPLDLAMQRKLIEKSTKKKVKGKNVKEIPSGFIGEIIADLRKQNYEPIAIFCGTDRVKTYQDQINRYKERLNINIRIEETKRTDEDISASKVREAIKNDNYNAFNGMTLGLDRTDFTMLKTIIK
jgi:hypothetical protein